MKIVILGNCQVGSIADSLTRVVHGAFCESSLVSNEPMRLKSELKDAMSKGPDVVILHDSVMRLVDGHPEFGGILPSNLVVIPTVVFTAFHPDIQYAFADRGVVKNGLSSDWNSRILLWAYLHGIPVHSALNLFQESTFKRLGYFDEWSNSEAILSSAFSECGLDFREWMRSVQRTGNFMYGINHPKVIALKYLALQIASQHFGGRGTGVEGLDSLVDYLSHIVWPVYPEIGRRLGVSASNMWQVYAKKVELAEFATLCYRKWDDLGLKSKSIQFVPECGKLEEDTLTQAAQAL